MTAPRRALVGIADQIVSSATNYATAFIASLVLVPEQFGAYVVAFAVVTILATGVRAFLSEPLIAHLPVLPSADRRSVLAGSALGASVLAGVAGAAVLAVLGLVGWSTLLAFVPWLPGALIADVGRYVLLARLDTTRTLVVDLVWAVTQGAALTVVAFGGIWTPATVAATWGIGAWAAVGALAVVGVRRAGWPGEWLREGRYLAGWFTVVSIFGQAQMYAVLLIAGAFLTAQDMAGLRAVQLLILMPPTTLMGALFVLATPMFSRCVAADDPAALRRLRRLAILAMAALGVVVLTAIPLRDVLLGLLFPRYTGFGSLVAPIALQVAILGLGVPFAASLRGMRLGSTLLAVQLVTTAGLLIGAVIGLVVGGVVGLAWGMTAAALVTVTVEGVVGVRARPASLPDLVTT